jgi:hypothetical protein
MSNSKAGGEDDITASGKYLLISVPDFGDDPIHGTKMTSYLRLGAASTTWQEDPGGDLAGNVHLSGPPGRSKPGVSEQVVDILGDVDDARPVFVDDTRLRVPGAREPDLSVGERLNESNVLHTRGGWRDHSDGNRISTTYGDKIEVIRGNYKMVVLGRQDDPGVSTGWDTSGHHIQDWGMTMPGASVRVEYTQEYGGVWHLQNTTEGVVQSSNFAGDFFEYKWGDKHYSTIGSESPHPFDDIGGTQCPRTNPHIRQKTWAEKIESYTGSAVLPVPILHEETWALASTSLTNVAALISETTICPGAVITTSTLGAVTDTTVAGTVLESTTVATSMTSSTTCPLISETTTCAGAMSSITTAGNINEVTTVGAMSGITLAGTMAEISVSGPKLGIDLAITKTSIDIAALVIELTAALKLTFELSASIEIYVGAKLELQAAGGKKLTTDGEEVAITKKTVAGVVTLTAANIQLN